MKIIIKILCLLILSLNFLTGCALLRPADKESTKYVLDQLPSQVSQRHTRQATLIVLIPETSAVYNTSKMAYSLFPHQVAYYTQNEWGGTPSQMLHPLIVRSIQNTHYFNAVVTPPFKTKHAFILRTEVLELLQDFTVTPARLRMTLRVTLSSAENSLAIVATEFSAVEPMFQQSPQGGVLAANRATAKILQNINHLIIKKLGRTVLLKN